MAATAAVTAAAAVTATAAVAAAAVVAGAVPVPALPAPLLDLALVLALLGLVALLAVVRAMLDDTHRRLLVLRSRYGRGGRQDEAAGYEGGGDQSREANAPALSTGGFGDFNGTVHGFSYLRGAVSPGIGGSRKGRILGEDFRLPAAHFVAAPQVSQNAMTGTRSEDSGLVSAGFAW
ncbi:hypothetical protein [Streptomyces actinomycinicus]|uniref:hypothetical protein n=1 Tax=Streptomyces actinomycinicus TaxID=1695166 RepID=UPI0035F44CA7